jgi:hypothetical protein
MGPKTNSLNPLLQDLRGKSRFNIRKDIIEYKINAESKKLGTRLICVGLRWICGEGGVYISKWDNGTMGKWGQMGRIGRIVQHWVLLNVSSRRHYQNIFC